MTKDRFEFGKNWESFSPLIDEEAIRKAEDRMALFLGTRDLSGRTFLDVGCGSGLHALVALRFGAKEVVAIDVDPDSVSTAGAVLERNWPGTNKTVRQVSVFDLEKERFGEFDIVYSWGVLHHTGDMNRARGKSLSKHIAGYKHKRGMDFLHDVRDWIGGYPYESIAPRELAQLLTPLGFDLIRQNVRKRSGLFGSGNDEYLFRRHDAASNSRHP